MERLAKLSGLSHAKKDHLIHSLWSIIGELRQEVSGLREQAHRLEIEKTSLQAQAAKHSSNSSKPPASDGLRKTRSLRKQGERPVGGVPGHKGSTLERSATPEHIVEHLPLPQCEACGTRLEPGEYQARQVFDLPQPVLEVTEHRAWQARCGCGHLQQGAFPDEVKAPVQYGARFKAAVVYLTQYQMLPAKRTGELLEALCGTHPSTGTVMNLIEQGRRRLEAPHRALAEALLRQPVVGADETGARVEGRLHWLHVLASESLSWLSVHPKRGLLAFEELGVLPRFRNILVHDGFKSYAKLECAHALCNAHLLRELTFQAEFRQQDWAKAMIGLLCEALKTTRLHPQGLSRSQVEDLRSRYEAVLEGGWKLNPPEPPDGGPGRTAQTDTVNLLRRLQDGADEVLHFTRNPQVTFTNNEAEREVRMPKVKLKVAGSFRTPWGVQAFCITRSYLSTLKKQGRELLPSLEATFNGDDPLMGLDI